MNEHYGRAVSERDSEGSCVLLVDEGVKVVF